MKKVCICLIAVLLLCGCGNGEDNTETKSATSSTHTENTTSDTETENATNIASEYEFLVPTFSQVGLNSITDFKCTVSYNGGEEEVVIEDYVAKELYRILTEVEKTEEAVFIADKKEYISLQFESSETGEHINEIFIINITDEMAYCANPLVSHQPTYKVEEGTYSKLILILNTIKK